MCTAINAKVVLGPTTSHSINMTVLLEVTPCCLVQRLHTGTCDHHHRQHSHFNVWRNMPSRSKYRKSFQFVHHFSFFFFFFFFSSFSVPSFLPSSLPLILLFPLPLHAVLLIVPIISSFFPLPFHLFVSP